jgi:hypothetical protein
MVRASTLLFGGAAFPVLDDSAGEIDRTAYPFGAADVAGERLSNIDF